MEQTPTLQQQIDALTLEIEKLKQPEALPYKLDSKPLDNALKEDTFLIRQQTDSFTFAVNVRVPDTSAATAANYGAFFIAPMPVSLVKAYERHGTAGTAGGTVTLDLEKLANATAKGAGVSMVATTFDLKATADTYQLIKPSTTLANRRLAIGEAIALKTSGTLTSVNDVVVTLVLKVELKNLPL